MKEKFRKIIEKIWNSTAAIIIIIAAGVFLCGLTALEFTALHMEWNIPALAKFTGGADSYIFEEYRGDELELDASTENVPAEETGSDGKEIASETEPGTETEYTEHTAETEYAGQAAEQQPEFPYYIKINRSQNCITVYTMDENGAYTVPCRAMICSTGLYNATPKGIYHTSDKYLWRELHGKVYGQYATRIHRGILFHSVPYYKKAKNTLCTDKYNKLGQQASMGCVRLTVEDAKWIMENCPSGTTVEVYEDDDPGPLGKPKAAHIDPESPNKGWDPTDPDEDNPWHAVLEEE